MFVTSRKSFLSPHGVGFDIWITCGICHLNYGSMKSQIWEILFNGPWDTGFIIMFSLEKHNQGRKTRISKSHFSVSLHQLWPFLKQPPTQVPHAFISNTGLGNQCWEKQFFVRNLNYYSKPSNSEIPAVQRDAVQGGDNTRAVKWFTTTPKCRRCSDFPSVNGNN